MKWWQIDENSLYMYGNSDSHPNSSMLCISGFCVNVWGIREKVRTCVALRMCTTWCVCVCVCVRACVHAYVYACVRACVCVCACVRVCMCVCVRACVRACVCVLYVPAYVRTTYVRMYYV